MARLANSGLNPTTLRAAVTLVLVLAFAGAPLLTAPFTGFDPATLPYDVSTPPVQPAGYAFAVWGVIYLWLIASAGYGLWHHANTPNWDAMRWPLIVSAGIGAIWIEVALRSPIWATILIFVMLITAVLACLRAPISPTAWARAPLGLYAGWLSAAGFVALATTLTGFDIVPREIAGWAGLLGALATASALTTRLRVITYPIAVIWALVGVIVSQWQSDPSLSLAAVGGIAALAYQGIRARA